MYLRKLFSFLPAIFSSKTELREAKPSYSVNQQGDLLSSTPGCKGVGMTGVESGELKYAQAYKIAKSLRECPNDWAWAMPGYEIQHVASGFKLWVANEDYGLAEIAGNGKIQLPKEEQAIIWPHVKVWLGLNRTSFYELPKPRLRVIDSGWECIHPNHPWLGVGATQEEAYEAWALSMSQQRRKNSDKLIACWIIK